MAIGYSILGRRRRLAVREVARNIRVHYPHLKDERLRKRLTDELGNRSEFQSIWATLLVAVAVKLAEALILYWIDQRLRTPPLGDFRKGEPGA